MACTRQLPLVPVAPSGKTATTVVDHGVTVPDGVRYAGELERGIVVVNGVRQRGWEPTCSGVPGAAWASTWSGCSRRPWVAWVRFLHRSWLPSSPATGFFFHPVRYTSLGLALCEAMMLSVPVVALATTEVATVVEDGVSGYLDTSLERLTAYMQHLLDDPEDASRMGCHARRTALDRFSIRALRGRLGPVRYGW